MIVSESTLLFVCVVAIVLLAGVIIHLELRIKRLLRGKTGKTLEDTIIALIDHAKEYEQEKLSLDQKIAVIEKKLKQTIRGVDTVRFNPFPDQGGNHSFATAFIDEEGNGVVFSSLYARDRMSIFAKPLTKHNSSFELTEEEANVIENAKKGIF